MRERERERERGGGGRITCTMFILIKTNITQYIRVYKLEAGMHTIRILF